MEERKRGNKGVRGEVASGWWRVASKRREGEGVGRDVWVPVAVPGRSEMVQEERPLSIAGGA